MDTYFKICHAKEKIKCLNIEIHRIITYMHFEEVHLRHRERLLAATNPALALQISSYQRGREHFYAMHMRCFYALSLDPGFTGNIGVGTVAGQCPGFGLEYQEGNLMNLDSEHLSVRSNPDSDSNDSDNEEHEKAVDEEVQAIMQISTDTSRD